MLERRRDITLLEGDTFPVVIDGEKVLAATGETVLSVLLATGRRELMENDYKAHSGAYCGMGVCQCCQVQINGSFKRRACQTVIEPHMDINTQVNRFQSMGIPS